MLIIFLFSMFIRQFFYNRNYLTGATLFKNNFNIFWTGELLTIENGVGLDLLSSPKFFNATSKDKSLEN